MYIKCDRLRSVDKRAELNCLVDHHNPLIILGQASRFGPDISYFEVFQIGSKSIHSDQVIIKSCHN